jgi:hypothetical protein
VTNSGRYRLWWICASRLASAPEFLAKPLSGKNCHSHIATGQRRFART